MKIVIYHTTDMHGHVFPTNYVDYQNLGMLKIFSFIEEDSKNYDHRLLLEGGDLIQGTVLTNFLSKKRYDVNPILKLLDAVGYDAYVMGNHEFNYGLEHLRNSYELVSSKILNSNIKNLGFDSNPYKIFDFDGYKVAVFGATTSYIPNWEQSKNIEGLEFLNPIDQYAKYEKEMIENSNKIIALYHGGFEKSIDGNFIPTERANGENQGSEFLEKFDSIDIMLTGHQHRSFITKIDDVICSQPINNARNFTKIVIDTQKDSINYELIDLANFDIKPLSKYEYIFSDVNIELEKYLNQIIGHVEEDMVLDDLKDVRLHGHPYINILHQIQLDALNADFSATTLFDQAIGLKKDIKIKDVLINYPYPNTLKVLEVTGHDIKDAIEVSATYFIIDENGEIGLNPRYQIPKIRNYIYDFYYGLEFVADLNRPFKNRVISITKDGKDLDLNKTYKIIVNNYRSTNYSDYPSYENKKVIMETTKDFSELMIEYIQNNKEIKIDKTVNFRFIK